MKEKKTFASRLAIFFTTGLNNRNTATICKLRFRFFSKKSILDNFIYTKKNFTIKKKIFSYL
jgi:hypothetical protein